MAKHTIGWLPGDGIGIEVLAAARVVLDRLGLDADYRRGRHRLGVLAARRGRFPSEDDRPSGERGCRHVRGHHLQAGQDRGGRAGARPCRARAWSTARPSCGCASCSTSTSACGPCKAYPSNPLNYKEGIDLVVFRENTEDLYAGVEFGDGAGRAGGGAGQALEELRSLPGIWRATSTPSRAR